MFQRVTFVGRISVTWTPLGLTPSACAKSPGLSQSYSKILVPTSLYTQRKMRYLMSKHGFNSCVKKKLSHGTPELLIPTFHTKTSFPLFWGPGRLGCDALLGFFKCLLSFRNQRFVVYVSFIRLRNETFMWSGTVCRIRIESRVLFVITGVHRLRRWHETPVVFTPVRHPSGTDETRSLSGQTSVPTPFGPQE